MFGVGRFLLLTSDLGPLVVGETAHVSQRPIEMVPRVRDPGDHRFSWIQVI